VAILHDPLRLASLRIVGALSGMVRYVHHTGAGIRGGGAADRARGRAANFWEYDGSGPNRPSLAEAVEKYRAVDSLIPADAPNWNSMKGHWPTTRLTVDAVWSDDAKNIDHGAVRVYGSCSSEGFAGIVFGVRRYVQVMSHFGPWHLQVFDVATGALVYAQAVGIEHEFRLDGDPNIWGSAPSEAGSSRAYLVLGNR
jgi:hypothetical protein